MPPRADISGNLDAVRRRIHAAAHRVGRSGDDVTLVAVSKTFPAEAVAAAAEAGQRVFGENRVQEAAAKAETLRALGLEWHLIGHLQTNKIKRAVSTFSCIQSVDSLDLLAKLNRSAQEAGTRPSILIQADLAQEATKFGAAGDALRDLVTAADQAPALSLCGLMIIPPNPDTPEDSRRWFRALRDLRDQFVADGVPAASLRELSMGMSHDFEVAVEEGSTIVRVGTAIFGHRDSGAPSP